MKPYIHLFKSKLKRILFENAGIEEPLVFDWDDIPDMVWESKPVGKSENVKEYGSDVKTMKYFNSDIPLVRHPKKPPLEDIEKFYKSRLNTLTRRAQDFITEHLERTLSDEKSLMREMKGFIKNMLSRSPTGTLITDFKNIETKDPFSLFPEFWKDIAYQIYLKYIKRQEGTVSSAIRTQNDKAKQLHGTDASEKESTIEELKRLNVDLHDPKFIDHIISPSQQGAFMKHQDIAEKFIQIFEKIKEQKLKRAEYDKSRRSKR